MSSEFFDVAARQRACRNYADEPVSDGELATMLHAATRAPSAENSQPWEWIVVRDAESRAAIGALTERAWESGGELHAEHRLDPVLLRDVEAGARGGVSGAPVLVVACVDLERGLEQTIGSSIFPAVQNLLLAATALGLGSALTTIATVYESELQQLLGLPDHVRPVAILPIGRPGRPLGAPRREPFAEHAHRDRYGSHW
ncbi:MAG: nitroreductase family protein [Acidimicrobiia bacterium]